MKPFPIRSLIPPPAARRVRFAAQRSYAVQAPGAPTFEVFNRRTKLLQKERAAANVEKSREVDYLRDETAFRLCERLLDINRRFDRVLDLGANACNIGRILTKPDPDATSMKPVHEPLATRIGELVAVDSSPAMLYRDADQPFNNDIKMTRQVLTDEESLPFEPESFDAVLSSLSLHWINDLPSVLKQINNILKPDAPFMGVMLGGDSLFELRTSLQLAELDRRGGVSTRTSPLADVRDVGGLLQSAGFKLLTVDVDDIVVDYPSIFALMTDLQAMGENNAVLGREMGPIKRDVLLAAEVSHAMMEKLLPVIHLAQAAGSTYTLYFCYVSIKNLQQYEKKSEKAAEYSATAAEQLHKTRTTQGNALVTVLTSLLTSAFLLYTAVRPGEPSHPSSSPWLAIGLNAGNIANTLLTRKHVAGFWEGKAKVPFVEGYNDAISSTLVIIKALEKLAVGWSVSAAITSVGMLMSR
ncbi:Methyltransferase type 11 [Neofusicoccum parvum]|nr:Methyltransferase type 11 [Neofusicoccum parvum]